jgi:hypothetical protein
MGYEQEKLKEDLRQHEKFMEELFAYVWRVKGKGENVQTATARLMKEHAVLQAGGDPKKAGRLLDCHPATIIAWLNRRGLNCTDLGYVPKRDRYNTFKGARKSAAFATLKGKP